jgi:hypothetical protein
MKTHEQRRFPRVHLQDTLSEVIGALGAQITWPNLETSAIVDLGYKGFAVRRPGLFNLSVHDKVWVEVELGGLKTFRSEARVAWTNPQAAGLEMLEMPAEGHLAMSAFLDAKLLGTQLQPVSRGYFAPHLTFDYWYQGPDETHVFVWLNSVGFVKKVSVQRRGVIVELVRGDRLNHLSEEQFQSLLILSQMDHTQLPMEEFVRCLRGDRK